MIKLTQKEIGPLRKGLAMQQSQRCGICGYELSLTNLGPKRPVLDHDHSTGFIRDVLHASCNSLLGKIENNAPRYGFVDGHRLRAFLRGVGNYMLRHETPQHEWIHPTHKTAEEKRLAKNAKARKARAKRKA